MFDLSFAELALAGFAAIVAVKPDDMPGFLRGCGKKWREFGRWRTQWSSEMQAMLDPDGKPAGGTARREMYVPDGAEEAFERYVIENSGEAVEYDDTDEDELYAAEHADKTGEEAADSPEDKPVPVTTNS